MPDDPTAPEDWQALQQRIIDCERCPRLRAWCEKIAEEKRAAYANQTYWGKPVPNLAPPNNPTTARLLIVGLAPAAHGANRTGRMFTGDRSGDFLFEAMYKAGFANQPTGTHRGDGLALIDCCITAAAHCAPPKNKPTAAELNDCATHLDDTIDLLPDLTGFLCLGGIGYNTLIKYFRRRHWPVPSPKPKFGHGTFHDFSNDEQSVPWIACTYHPSQQNTFTGRLTMDMLVDVLNDCRARLD